jgi:hypothetical protein
MQHQDGWRAEFDQLSATAAAEHQQFAERIVVGSAESVVASARIADLRAAQVAPAAACRPRGAG